MKKINYIVVSQFRNDKTLRSEILKWYILSGYHLVVSNYQQDLQDVIKNAELPANRVHSVYDYFMNAEHYQQDSIKFKIDNPILNIKNYQVQPDDKGSMAILKNGELIGQATFFPNSQQVAQVVFRQSNNNTAVTMDYDSRGFMSIIHYLTVPDGEKLPSISRDSYLRPDGTEAITVSHGFSRPTPVQLEMLRKAHYQQLAGQGLSQVDPVFEQNLQKQFVPSTTTKIIKKDRDGNVIGQWLTESLNSLVEIYFEKTLKAGDQVFSDEKPLMQFLANQFSYHKMDNLVYDLTKQRITLFNKERTISPVNGQTAITFGSFLNQTQVAYLKNWHTVFPLSKLILVNYLLTPQLAEQLDVEPWITRVDANRETLMRNDNHLAPFAKKEIELARQANYILNFEKSPLAIASQKGRELGLPIGKWTIR